MTFIENSLNSHIMSIPNSGGGGPSISRSNTNGAGVGMIPSQQRNDAQLGSSTGGGPSDPLSQSKLNNIVSESRNLYNLCLVLLLSTREESSYATWPYRYLPLDENRTILGRSIPQRSEQQAPTYVTRDDKLALDSVLYQFTKTPNTRFGLLDEKSIYHLSLSEAWRNNAALRAGLGAVTLI